MLEDMNDLMSVAAVPALLWRSLIDSIRILDWRTPDITPITKPTISPSSTATRKPSGQY
jgi:hypothetical protein